MKTTNLMIMMALVALLCNCKKEEVKPQPTRDELNEQYKIKYARIGFYTSDKDERLLGIRVSMLPTQTAWVGYQGTVPDCETYPKYSLDPTTVCSYTAMVFESNTDSIKVIKRQWTGTVTAGDYECKLIDIKEQKQ